MKRLLALALLLCAQAAGSACLSVDCGCPDFYHGELWIEEGNTVVGTPGVLTDYYVGPDYTYFEVNGTDYLVPNRAIVGFDVNQQRCSFAINYDDNITQEGFE